MKISKAETKDIPQLCKLLSVLFSQEAEFHPDEEKQFRGLELIISNPSTGFILKAEKDGKIIGMVNILYSISTFLGGRVSILEDMIVLPEARGENIGSLLITEAEKIAKSEGSMRITLLTDGDNTGGQRFYERHGYTTSPMITYRKLIR